MCDDTLVWFVILLTAVSMCRFLTRLLYSVPTLNPPPADTRDVSYRGLELFNLESSSLLSALLLLLLLRFSLLQNVLWLLKPAVFVFT